MEPLDIQFKRLQLEAAVQEYSQAHVFMWNKVPRAAIEADGRTGYSAQFANAYQHRLWRLNSSIVYGRYTAAVDLRNGLIVDLLNPSRKADGNIVAHLAYHLEELNGTSVLADIVAHSKMPHVSSYNEERQEAWRKEMRKRYLWMNDDTL